VLEDIRGYLPIDERIGTAGQPTEAQLRDVASGGYAAVINLGLLDPKYCLPDEEGLAASLGLAYRHIPVKFDAPTLDDFAEFRAAMDAWSDRRVLVHCAANYRVSAFMAIYGELRLGWTRGEAEAHARRLWSPNEVWLGFLRDARERFLGA
jgi:protein tyrosine phosphatase (PTP) superfamily phosphohydrolase (DUF442 family)